MTEEFRKYFKISKLFFIVGVILIVNFFVLEIVFFLTSKYNYENPESLFYVDTPNRYCYVDVIKVYPPFTIYRKSGNYMGWLYIAYDENFMYVANLSPADRKRLATNMQDTLSLKDIYEMDTVRIYGMSVETDAFLEYRVINLFPDVMTFDNVKDYIGTYYINTRSNPNLLFLERTKYVSISLISGLFLVAIYIYKYQRRRKFLTSNYEDLKEMEKELVSLKVDKKHKLIFSSNYTYSYQGKSKLIKNDDVIWVYPLEFLYPRKRREVTIYAVLKGGDVIELTSYIYKIKNLKEHLSYVDSFKKVYPKALHGYTTENFKKVRGIANEKE